MFEARAINTSKYPPLYTDHVVVERLRGGSYRVFGRSNLGGLTFFVPRRFASLDSAIAASKEWANSHAIAFVHIVDEPDKPAASAPAETVKKTPR